MPLEYNYPDRFARLLVADPAKQRVHLDQLREEWETLIKHEKDALNDVVVRNLLKVVMFRSEKLFRLVCMFFERGGWDLQHPFGVAAMDMIGSIFSVPGDTRRPHEQYYWVCPMQLGMSVVGCVLLGFRPVCAMGRVPKAGA